jgi:hypothetical protein
MQSQFDHQYQLKSRIDQYHRDAIRAEQLHIARTGPPNRIVGATMKLNTSMRTRLTAAHAYVRRPVTVSLEPDVEAVDPRVTA